MQKYFITFFFLFQCIIGLSQDKGTALFSIEGGKAWLKINNEVIEVKGEKELSLLEGSYPFQIWAPNFEIIYDTIKIEARKSTTYKNILRYYTDDYRTYLKDIKSFNYKKGRRKLNIVLSTGIPSILLGSSYFINKSILDEQRDILIGHKTSYENATTRNVAEASKSSYNIALKRYNNKITVANTTTWASAALLAAGTYFAFLHPKRIKFKEEDKPKRPKVENPFTLKLSFLENSADKQLTVKIIF